MHRLLGRNTVGCPPPVGFFFVALGEGGRDIGRGGVFDGGTIGGYRVAMRLMLWSGGFVVAESLHCFGDV